MSVLTVPYLAGALLLVAAGLTKVVAPDSTVSAARGGGVPATPTTVRLLAAAEVIAGGLALGVDGWAPGVLLGAFYAGFAAFLARGLVRGDLDSCGCFAGDRAEPSWLHVAVDLGFAGAAALVATGSADASLAAAYDVGNGPVTTILVLLAASLAYLVLSHLPRPGILPEGLLADDVAAAR